MLQSPKFLFHVEGGPCATSPRLTKSPAGLSYFLWDTMPDRAPVRGGGERRAANARTASSALPARMLEQPPARQAVDEFFAQWLRFDRVLGSVKDRRQYPEFTPELAAMMVQETRMLLDNLVWNDGNFMEAFTADYSFLNSDLRGPVRRAGAGRRVRARAVPGDCAPRAACSARRSFLASNAGPVETSPTARGIFVREQLLCQHVPNPPPGVNTHAAGADGRAAAGAAPAHAGARRESDVRELSSADGSDRLRTGELRRHRPVARPGSHRIRVPGRRGRPTTRRCRLPIDGKGEIAGLTNSAFSEPRTLGRLLADSRACQECVVQTDVSLCVWPCGDARRSRDDRSSVSPRSATRDSSSRNC